MPILLSLIALWSIDRRVENRLCLLRLKEVFYFHHASVVAVLARLLRYALDRAAADMRSRMCLEALLHCISLHYQLLSLAMSPCRARPWVLISQHPCGFSQHLCSLPAASTVCNSLHTSSEAAACRLEGSSHATAAGRARHPRLLGQIQAASRGGSSSLMPQTIVKQQLLQESWVGVRSNLLLEKGSQERWGVQTRMDL